MFEVLRRWWDRGRQRIDLAILWPVTRDQAELKTDEEAQELVRARQMPESRTPQLSIARYAFILHMKYDSAWREVQDWDAEQLEEFVEKELV